MAGLMHRAKERWKNASVKEKSGKGRQEKRRQRRDAKTHRMSLEKI